MQPFAVDPLFRQVGRQILGEALGQRGDQHALAGSRPLANLFQQVGDLALSGTDFDHRVQQAGGADDLRHNFAPRLFQLVGARRGRHEDHLVDSLFPFLKFQRAVVQGAGQPKSMFHQHRLATVVPRIHRSDLRYRGVRLVHEQEKILGEEIV